MTEDFTSDDLLSPGFTSPGTNLLSEPAARDPLGEEEQNQPIEIPRGQDDNSESHTSCHRQSLTLGDRCGGQEALCGRSQLGDQGASAEGLFREVRGDRVHQSQAGPSDGTIAVLRVPRIQRSFLCGAGKKLMMRTADQFTVIDTEVLGGGEHAINSKKVDVKRARAKPGKIFVGGLTETLSDEEIRNYFSQFGSVTECEMPFDKTKNQRKNFCFITFEREETMKEVLKIPKQKIGEVEVDVKKATPKLGKSLTGIEAAHSNPSLQVTEVGVTEEETSTATWITTATAVIRITTAGGRALQTGAGSLSLEDRKAWPGAPPTEPRSVNWAS